MRRVRRLRAPRSAGAPSLRHGRAGADANPPSPQWARMGGGWRTEGRCQSESVRACFSRCASVVVRVRHRCRLSLVLVARTCALCWAVPCPCGILARNGELRAAHAAAAWPSRRPRSDGPARTRAPLLRLRRARGASGSFPLITFIIYRYRPSAAVPERTLHREHEKLH